MATNRRKGQGGLGAGTVARALLLSAMIAALGIHYVRMHAEQIALGRRIADLEKQEQGLSREIDGAMVVENELLTRPRLMEAVQRFGLNLVTPLPSQRLNIEVPGAGATGPGPGPAGSAGPMVVLGVGGVK